MKFPWIKRQDLIVQAHDSGGWLIKDPLTLTYTLLEETEFQILQLMDGTRTVPQLLAKARRWVPDGEVTANDLSQFVQSLAGHQLIRQSVSGDSQRLRSSNPGWTQRLLRIILNVLRIQIPLVNPSRWIDRALPVLNIFFSSAARKLAAVIVLFATIVATANMSDIVSDLPSMEHFLGPSNLALLLITFVFIKCLHEAGHAVSARYYGAECNECGVMLMVLTPVLYTDVTDGWRLPRSQRLKITAAGIVVELVIAAIATLLWWQAGPGLTKSLLLNVMLICSVNTLLFNGNPLLRFDGYFLLSDWLRIPNLSSRAGVVLREFIVGLVVGGPTNYSEPRSMRAVLLAYGFAAGIYRTVLSLAIAQFIRSITKEVNAEFIGTTISLTLLITVVVLPLIRFVQEIRLSISEHDTTGFSKLRPLLAAAIVSAVFFVPLPASIVTPATIVSAGVPVYVQLPGQMTPAVAYGEAVATNTPLASLWNLKLARTRSQLLARVDELSEQIDTLTKNPQTANSPLIPTLQTAKESAQADLEEFDAELQLQTILSPASGMLLPPIAIQASSNTTLPEHWHGLPLDAINTDAWMRRGTHIGYVGSPRQLKLICCISENDVANVRPGQSARFLVTGGRKTFKATVTDVSGLPATELAMRLGVAGLVAGSAGSDGWMPAETIYLLTAEVTVEDDETPPACHSVGHARIQTSSLSVARRLIRYLRRTFS